MATVDDDWAGGYQAGQDALQPIIDDLSDENARLREELESLRTKATEATQAIGIACVKAGLALKPTLIENGTGQPSTSQL